MIIKMFFCDYVEILTMYDKKYYTSKAGKTFLKKIKTYLCPIKIKNIEYDICM